MVIFDYGKIKSPLTPDGGITAKIFLSVIPPSGVRGLFF
jgi:hypothetical protein